MTKEYMPDAYDRLPDGMVEDVFHKVTNQEIKAPITRDLYSGDYELNVGQKDIDQRTVMANGN